MNSGTSKGRGRVLAYALALLSVITLGWGANQALLLSKLSAPWLAPDTLNLGIMLRLAAIVCSEIVLIAAVFYCLNTTARRVFSVLTFLFCLLTACNLPYISYFGTIIHLRKVTDAYTLAYVWGHVAEQVLTPTFYLQLLLSVFLLIALWVMAPREPQPPAIMKKLVWVLLPAVILHSGIYHLQKARTNMAVSQARFLVGNSTAYFLYGFTPVYMSMLEDLFRSGSGHTFVEPINTSLNHDLERIDMPMLEPEALFIIQAESLDRSAINKTSSKGVKLMPFLNSLLSESVVLKNYYLHHNGAASASAEIATLLSIVPSDEFNGLVTIDAPNVHALNHALERRGFVSMFLHSNEGSFFGRKDAYRKMAFQHFFDMSFYTGPAAGFLAKDKAFFKQSLPLIVENTPEGKKPFAYFVTMQSHGPFVNYDKATAEQLKTEGFDTANEPFLLDYLSSMRELDEALAWFWENAVTSSTYTRPLVIIHPDHQSGVLDQAPDKIESGMALIWSPQLQPRVIDAPTSSYDIAPTIMHLLNTEANWEEAGWWIGDTVFTVGTRKVIQINNIVLENDNGDHAKRKTTASEKDLLKFSLQVQQ